MAIVAWDDKYAINIEELDTDHKKIFKLINEVHNAGRLNNNEEILEDVLLGLLDFTMIHFKKEEGMMLSTRYPDYLSHKREHKSFYDHVTLFKREYRDHIPTLAEEITSYLLFWIDNHIAKADVKFALFYNKRGRTL